MGCSSKTTIELSIPFPPCDNLSSPCSSAIFLLTCSLVGSYSLSSLHKLPPANNSKSSAEAGSQCWTHFPKEDGLLASIKKELEQWTRLQNIVENGFWSSQMVNPLDSTGISFKPKQAQGGFSSSPNPPNPNLRQLVSLGASGAAALLWLLV